MVNGLTCASHCMISQGGQGTTLTAVASAGSSFSNWSGACTGFAPVCTVYPDGATSLTATFTPQSTALLTTVSGPGVVTSGYTLLPITSPVHLRGLLQLTPAVSCGSPVTQPPKCDVTSFAPGEQVLLTANPDPGAVFVSWGGACAQYVTADCYVEAGSLVGVTATFEFANPSRTEPSLEIVDYDKSLVSGPANALADCIEGKDCVASTTPDETVTLEAGAPFELGTTSPNAPSIAWSGDCVGSWPVCALVVDNAGLTTEAVVSVRNHPFFVDGYPVSLTVDGAGAIYVKGSTGPPCSARDEHACSPIELPNRSVTLLAKPGSAHWKFRRWQAKSQGCSGTKATCTFTTGAGQSEIGVFSKKG
jgi:Divergent InlB B-repeat domain